MRSNTFSQVCITCLDLPAQFEQIMRLFQEPTRTEQLGLEHLFKNLCEFALAQRVRYFAFRQKTNTL